MDFETANRVLLLIALKNQTTVEVVTVEIERTIAISLETARQNKDTEVLERWKKIPCAGAVPTAVELIAYLGGCVRKGCCEDVFLTGVPT